MQNTVANIIELSGIGIHSGNEVNIKIMPAVANMGIVFKRVDLGADALIPANYKYVHSTQSCTSLVKDGAAIATVEHLLSACFGMGVDNAVVEVDAAEMPIMDGSALVFARAIDEVGLKTQDVSRDYLTIDQEIKVELEDKYITLKPYAGFKIDWTVAYDHPLFTKDNTQATFDASVDSYLDVCAPARTYGFMHEYEYLLKNNLAKGASLDNVLVLDGPEVKNPEGMRFADECVRHKILDCIGDMALYGKPILGEITAYKSGHTLNAALVRELVAIYDPS